MTIVGSFQEKRRPKCEITIVLCSRFLMKEMMKMKYSFQLIYDLLIMSVSYKILPWIGNFSIFSGGILVYNTMTSLWLQLQKIIRMLNLSNCETLLGIFQITDMWMSCPVISMLIIGSCASRWKGDERLCYWHVLHLGRRNVCKSSGNYITGTSHALQCKF